MKTFICPHCKQTITVDSSTNVANHIRWCKKNPKRSMYDKQLQHLHESYKGHKAWNLGLTASTNDSVKQAATRLHERYINGELIPSFSGKHHSAATKKKM